MSEQEITKIPTDLMNVQTGIEENIKLGFMKETSKGKYRLTPAGIAHVEGMIKKPKIEPEKRLGL